MESIKGLILLYLGLNHFNLSGLQIVVSGLFIFILERDGLDLVVVDF